MSVATTHLSPVETLHSHTSTSSPGIDTPESVHGSDDDLDGLEELEEHGGYELHTLSRKSRYSDNGGDPETREASMHSRRTSVQSFELYTPDEERALIRKLDVRLVLFVALLYMMSFLDRSNIGNAKIAGLMEDLDITDDQFQWLLTAFYVTYILFEWMTICYKIFPPHIYISCCVFAWGVLASLQSLVTSFPVMLLLRALLGIGEAAFVGVPFYLSFFFRRDELALRTGLFISAAPLATTFAGSLAWLIVRFGQGTGIASWRLLLLLEGFPACVVAITAWWWIPDSPGSTSWLSSHERRIAVRRLRRENRSSQKPPLSRNTKDILRHKTKFRWAEVRQTLLDPASYLTAGIFCCCNLAFASMPVFLPTIMNSMGFSVLASQGLSAPPYLVAFVVVLATAFWSDRAQSRSVPMVIHAVMATLGYAFLAISKYFQVGFLWRYLAIFPAVSGFFSAVTLIITWTINNQFSDEGKSTGMALNNFAGQAASLLGTRLYPHRDGPYFVRGMSVCAAAMAAVVVQTFVLRVLLQRRNRRRHSALSGPERSGLVSTTGKSHQNEPLYML